MQPVAQKVDLGTESLRSLNDSTANLGSSKNHQRNESAFLRRAIGDPRRCPTVVCCNNTRSARALGALWILCDEGELCKLRGAEKGNHGAVVAETDRSDKDARHYRRAIRLREMTQVWLH